MFGFLAYPPIFLFFYFTEWYRTGGVFISVTAALILWSAFLDSAQKERHKNPLHANSESTAEAGTLKPPSPEDTHTRLLKNLFGFAINAIMAGYLPPRRAGFRLVFPVESACSLYIVIQSFLT